MRATELSAIMAKDAERVCRHLLPNGHILRGNWVIGSVGGDAGKSLQIQISGPKAGQWLDFATKEKGDMIGLWMAVTGESMKDAYRSAAEFMGIEVEDDTPKEPSKTWVQIQREMGTGTEHDIATLMTLRRLPSDAGVRLAIENRVLFFGPVFDQIPNQPGESHYSWILTDDSRLGAQARRMDGLPWASGPKAKTIHGTSGKWPIGISNAGTLDVAMVEGGPDSLAAHTAIAMLGIGDKIQPVAMLGAGQPIHRDAVKFFRGKTVWMFPHQDQTDEGLLGAVRWADQLAKVGATVIPFDFRPYPGVKDLNDFVSALTPAPAVESMEID